MIKDLKKENSCCCGSDQNPELSFIVGTIPTDEGEIPKVRTDLNFNDKLGFWKMRLGIGRDQYMVDPGLYAVGNPNSESQVFVSANYKMSFDELRSKLSGIDGWILVLDTKGINVWCAAGKGTFGTNEIVNRVIKTKLDKIVSHKRLIVPQLGAPGIKAHDVKKGCGFRVVYGPIKAADIKRFLDEGLKADDKMRRMMFGIKDRAVLIPVEFTMALKYIALTALFLFVFGGFGDNGFSLENMLTTGLFYSILVFIFSLLMFSLIALLLPWLPGKAFALKGVSVGVILTLYLDAVFRVKNLSFNNIPFILGWLLVLTSLSSFTAMNFTGTSTYTSLSGVKKEMRIAVPLQIGGLISGLVLLIVMLFF